MSNRNEKNNGPKYIFIIGGVVSSVGKGVLASSLGALLKARKYKVFIQKFDPYLNLDPGTMNPQQHGEVFVTWDGAETDLDLGHYERFLGEELNAKSNVTAGKIFWEILQREREGYYLGNTVQYFPHVINLIKEKFQAASLNENYDFIITEIGGTVGDLELQAFLEAIRQFKLEIGEKNICNILITWMPYLETAGEHKTKPTQNTIKNLSAAGIHSDLLVVRSINELPNKYIEKLVTFAGLPISRIFSMPDIKFKYEAPLFLNGIRFDEKICEIFNKKSKANVDNWVEFIEKVNSIDKEINIGIVGKYVALRDSYISLYESINFACWKKNVKAKIIWIDSEKLTQTNFIEKLNSKNLGGIIVPGGFGERGIKGKILAIQYARENNIPFLGLCLGFQLAVIEYARNILNLKDANSSEFNKNSKHNIIDIIKGKHSDKNLGGSLRLGNYDCILKRNSLAHKIYKSDKIVERHRHRYEFNNKYLKEFLDNKKGGVFSGENPKSNLKEIFEINNHPFFISTQFHPEFKSRPFNPHPLFLGFVKSIIKK